MTAYISKTRSQITAKMSALSEAQRAKQDTLDTLAQLVGRMKEFWAFRSAALLITPRSANTVSPLLYSGTDKQVTFSPSEHSEKLGCQLHQFSAQPWVQLSNSPHKEAWFNSVAERFQSLVRSLKMLDFQDTGWALFVFIPHIDDIYTLVFANRLASIPFGRPGRNSRKVSPELVHAIVGTTAEILTQLEVAHPATVAAFNGLEHGLKTGALEVLLKVSSIVTALKTADGLTKPLRKQLSELYILALNITGPHDTLRAAWSARLATRAKPIKASIFVNNRLLIRTDYYEECADLKGKKFEFSDDLNRHEYGVHSICVNQRAVLGACDILVCNAIEHGGDAIRMSVRPEQSHLIISVQDNGRGLNDLDLAQMNAGSLLSASARFGLNAAKKALDASDCQLIVTTTVNPTNLEIHCPWFRDSP